MPIRSTRRAGGTCRVIAACFVALISSTTVALSSADDLGQVASDLTSASDFRVRVNAALALGRSHSPRSLAPLVKALDDGSPAVRAAAAAGLGVLGQAAAVPALRARAARERVPSARTQMSSAIASLEAAAKSAAPAKPTPARVVVKLGQLQNRSGVRGAQLSEIFRGATRARAGALPGVEVLGDDAESSGDPGAGRAPMLMLDGVVVRLARASEGERVTVSAEVEYVFRKMPEHSLRGTMSGAAKALGGSRAIADRARVALLEEQALQGAVDSAMRGAPEMMVQALR